jgi:hypothetical protein
MSKRLFWKLFWPAWDKAVSLANIESGFRKTGIHPLDPSVVLSQLAIRKPKSDSSESSDSCESDSIQIDPVTIRKLVKQVRSTDKITDRITDRIIESIERLSFENDILRHQNASLQFSVIEERKRRKRGKPMGLVDGDEPKFGQFFSPEKLARVKQARIDH